MLKRMIKMITKAKEDIRIKQARVEFENRSINNTKIAMYQHNKMLEVSKRLREKLRDEAHFSVNDYFAILTEVNYSQKQSAYGRILRKKPQRKFF